jgi:hypothetical protein
VAHVEFLKHILFSRGCSAVSELSPDVLSGGNRCFFCRARPFRTTNSTPLTAISRSLAPFQKFSCKAIIQKCLFQSAAPLHSWAPARSKIVDRTSHALSWGSGKWHPGDVSCPSEMSKSVRSVQGLNCKALEEAGR